MNLTTELIAFGPVAFAGLLGGIIGLEREMADKPAGLRTHIFVASGAALLVLLGESSIDFFQRQGSESVVEADPVRIVQAIVIGISFLGAGTIIHRGGNEVEGLTTAASIFLTAGIGIAVGVGRYILATETAVFAVSVLIGVRWLERYLLGTNPREEN
ncbi:MgtC/SapB family protein [Fuerstiella marisgermanici]|uniref:Putative Mg(2+) transport ATPase n=1 Tax=Fuerstiella marisgermanici TaxID=1891926 RepID=A0A1P8WDV5_9PLAN|nr:MgtC/SapB family protein [Fuerstiella marisgermanici]APZ92256.1 putative Mg(2+) transport ATPase [Fuerstiella marisgermanici]